MRICDLTGFDVLGLSRRYFFMTRCNPWLGNLDLYQEAAIASLIDSGKKLWPWVRALPNCDTPNCIEPTHLNLISPRALAYPSGTCVYCGDIEYSRDHLVPTALTGIGFRNQVLTVPSCVECNSFIGASLDYSIDGRRGIAHRGIAKKYKSVLARHEYSPEEIDEFEGMLKRSIVSGLEEKRHIESRLAWPDDPTYDLRHLQASGIENPSAVGLLVS